MRFRHRERGVPRLNTTSTADISFMLLIFFLVTTSMDTDKGLQRQLPPAENKIEQQETSVDKNLLLQLKISANNQLSINDHPAKMKSLRGEVLKLLHRVGNRHLISINCDPRASYDTYFHMQNEIVAAYKVWRNQTSLKRFKTSYAQLSAEERKQIDKACPQRIAEQYNGSQQEGGAQ
ncbi:MAG: ExbD/TolR family protein [Prevotella sp.]|jgi:biopolymer transport protein ExbD